MHLAYLLASAIEDESWTGGLLVTDQRGLPVDFRYIEPIRPSKIQKLIYGGALKRYLLLDAIAGTLLKASNSKADFVFTDEPLLLELDGDGPGKFVVIENGNGHPLQEVGEWQGDEPGKISMQVGASGPPATLIFKAGDETGTEKIASKLADLANDLNFTEPLGRVSEALNEICRNGKE